MKRLNADFFGCDSEHLGTKLLGKVLCIQTQNGVIRKAITETESYGVGDTACHASKGRTKRTEPLFQSGGTVYVYLCYGIHEILNIAAGKDGEGQGVMIRGIEGAVGPGRVAKILNIDRSFNYEFLPTSKRIWLEDGAPINESNIERLKRVGIGYALQEDQDRLWRFRMISDKKL